MLGSLAAVAWWNLVNKVVPYEDQKEGARGKRMGARDGDEVVASLATRALQSLGPVPASAPPHPLGVLQERPA